jgi:hypothetical protein
MSLSIPTLILSPHSKQIFALAIALPGWRMSLLLRLLSSVTSQFLPETPECEHLSLPRDPAETNARPPVMSLGKPHGVAYQCDGWFYPAPSLMQDLSN